MKKSLKPKDWFLVDLKNFKNELREGIYDGR